MFKVSCRIMSLDILLSIPDPTYLPLFKRYPCPKFWVGFSSEVKPHCDPQIIHGDRQSHVYHKPQKTFGVHKRGFLIVLWGYNDTNWIMDSKTPNPRWLYFDIKGQFLEIHPPSIHSEIHHVTYFIAFDKACEEAKMEQLRNFQTRWMFLLAKQVPGSLIPMW